MSRVEYCRQQAQLCRDMAVQLSNRSDALRLREMARKYETEADRINTSAPDDRLGAMRKTDQ